MADALFEREGDVYVPSGYVRGPWNFDHCHGGPPAGLLTTAILNQRPEMGMTRVTIDIPGPIPVVPMRIETKVLRPGNRITHIGAALVGLEGAAYASASAWMMRLSDDVFPQTQRVGESPPSVETATPISFNFYENDVDFSLAVEIRGAEGKPFAGGPATAWIRLLLPIIGGEENHPAALTATVADFQNGVSALAPFDELLCVNTDVTVYFARYPIGQWVSLKSTTNSSGLGLGMTDSLLYDVSGFVGTANQSIFFDSLHRREPENES